MLMLDEPSAALAPKVVLEIFANINRIAKSGYDLSLSDSLTYTRYKFFRGHFDFATSARLSIDSVTTLPQGASDHMAILVTSKLPESDEQHVIRAARPQPRGRANGWFRSAR